MGLRDGMKNLINKIKSIFSSKPLALGEGNGMTQADVPAATSKAALSLDEQIAAYDQELSNLYAQEATILQDVLEALNNGDEFRALHIELSTNQIALQIAKAKYEKGNLLFEKSVLEEQKNQEERRKRIEKLSQIRAKAGRGEKLTEEEENLLQEDRKAQIAQYMEHKAKREKSGVKTEREETTTVEEDIANITEKYRESKRAEDPNYELREAISKARNRSELEKFMQRRNGVRTVDREPQAREPIETRVQENIAPVDNIQTVEEPQVEEEYHVEPYKLENSYLVNQNGLYTDMMSVFGLPADQRRNFMTEEQKTSIMQRITQMKGVASLYGYSEADAAFINATDASQRKSLATQISMQNNILMSKRAQMCSTAMDVNKYNEAMSSIQPVTAVSGRELQEREDYMKALKSKLSMYGIDEAKVDAAFAEMQQKLATDGHSLESAGSTPLFLFTANEVENTLINLRTNELYPNRSEQTQTNGNKAEPESAKARGGLRRAIYSFLKKDQVRAGEIEDMTKAEKRAMNRSETRDEQSK